MKRLTEEIVTKAEASNARWDPLDLSVIDQIRRFEAEQPSATEEIVRRPSEALRLTQALLFNGTESISRYTCFGLSSGPKSARRLSASFVWSSRSPICLAAIQR